MSPYMIQRLENALKRLSASKNSLRSKPHIKEARCGKQVYFEMPFPIPGENPVHRCWIGTGHRWARRGHRD